MSKDALTRHRAEHLPASLVNTKAVEDEAAALDVVKQLKAANGLAWEVAREARHQEPDRVLRALDRIMKQIELQAELLQQIDRRAQVNITVSADWQTLRAELLDALLPYPAARVAVAERLIMLEARHVG